MSTTPPVNRMVLRPGVDRRTGGPLTVAFPSPHARRRLNPDGEPVELDQYWQRRLRDGDVVEVGAVGIGAEGFARVVAAVKGGGAPAPGAVEAAAIPAVHEPATTDEEG